MGLGKTIQSITFLSEIFLRGIHGPFLIIAPLSTITNWEREFRTWTEMNAIVYHGSQISRQMIRQYEMVYRDAQVSPPPVAEIRRLLAIVIHNSLPTPCLSGFNTLRGITVDLLCRVTYLLRQMSHSSLVTSSVIKHRTVGHAFHSDIHQRLFFRTLKAWLLGWLTKLLLYAGNFIWIMMCSVKKVSRGICEQRKDPQPGSWEREEVNGFEVQG